jgi:FkbM family methyltransferase
MGIRRAVQDAFTSLGWRVERIRDPFVDQKTLLGGNAAVVFDCGANLGNVARIYRETFPNATIYCFEASPNVYRDLLARNLPNVKAFNLAVSDKAGAETFYEYNLAGYNSFSKCTESFVTLTGEQTVKTDTLDNFCTRHGIGEIDILKMDIQGAELKALRGCARMLGSSSIKLIYSEVLFRKTYEQQAYFHEIAEILACFGFLPMRLYEVRYSPDRQLDYCDVIFCRQDIYDRKLLT